MDDNKRRPNNNSNDEQHTRQFDAVITPKTGSRNILRPDKNEQNPKSANRDVYISQNQRSSSNEGQYIMRPPSSNKPKSQNRGGPIPVSKPNQQQQQSPHSRNASVRRTGTAGGAVAPKPSPTAQKQKTRAGSGAVTRQKRDLKSKSNVVFFSVLLSIVLLATTIISAYGLTSLNDILALSRSNEKITVLVTEDMTTQDVITKLKDQGLIKNKSFCFLFAKLLKYEDADYLSGVHELRPNMGLEGMLLTMRSARTTNETVTLVFPEGYTVDQIFAKLEEYKVCTASSLFSTLNEVDFSKEYPFLKQIDNKAQRYRSLEGYLYPDTYNFFIGENASSVIKKFLNNFKVRWTDEYEDQAKKLNMSVDDVINLASVIEKEGKNRDQMFIISGILHNRLNDRTGSLHRLDCDSTYGYIMNIDKKLINANQYDRLFAAYDTYQIVGLPPGAICNPGDNAINAALFAEKTHYNFFRHDKAGKMYLAQTLSEHNANERKVSQANAAAAS